MFIASIVLISIVSLAYLTLLVLYKRPDKVSYQVKTLAPRFGFVFGSVLTLISLLCFATHLILESFDLCFEARNPLFATGCLTAFFGLLRFFASTMTFEAIEKDKLIVKRPFSGKDEVEIAEIRRISHSVLGVYLPTKERTVTVSKTAGRLDLLLDAIKKANPDIEEEDFDDSFALKRIRRWRIFYYVLMAITVASLTCRIIFDRPLDPVAKDNLVTVQGTVESTDKTAGKVLFYVYLQDDPVGYVVAEETLNFIDPSVYSDLKAGVEVTLLTEGNIKNDRYASDKRSRHDTICAIETDSKTYLTYDGYLEGINEKKVVSSNLYVFHSVVFAFFAIVLVENYYESSKGPKKSTKK